MIKSWLRGNLCDAKLGELMTASLLSYDMEWPALVARWHASKKRRPANDVLLAGGERHSKRTKKSRAAAAEAVAAAAAAAAAAASAAVAAAEAATREAALAAEAARLDAEFPAALSYFRADGRGIVVVACGCGDDVVDCEGDVNGGGDVTSTAGVDGMVLVMMLKPLLRLAAATSAATAATARRSAAR
ncbi:unnamed protein product [Closterium sp. NIES-54]